MQHWSEELCVKSWVAESVGQSISLVICTFRVNLAVGDLILVGNVIAELRIECPLDIGLEDDDHNNRRHCTDPLVGLPAQLQTGGFQMR